jgi:hypothetical protein
VVRGDALIENLSRADKHMLALQSQARLMLPFLRLEHGNLHGCIPPLSLNV